MDFTEQLLKELTETIGVSGFEDDVAKVMRKYLSDFTDISFDKLGSIIAKKKGKSESPKIMLAAHMDEVGFLVKKVTDKGFIKFFPSGGWNENSLLSQRVIIKSEKGNVIGMIGSKPVHEIEKEEQKSVKIKEMFIDVGSSKEMNVVKEFGIVPGDPIVPYSPFTITNNPKVYMAKAWDDRMGCGLIVNIMHELKNIEHNNTVYGVGTVSEETTGAGAHTASFSVEPDVCIVFDVGMAHDTPDSEDLGDESLGGGVCIVIYNSDLISNVRLRNLIVDIAKKENIPYYLSIWEKYGSDAGTVQNTRAGVPSIVIAPPIRYIHNTTGIMHRDDYDNTVKLISALIKRLDADTVNSLTLW